MITYDEQQEENSQLRAQLTRSMTSLISTGKVTTDHICTCAYKTYAHMLICTAVRDIQIHTNTNTRTHSSLRYNIKDTPFIR